MTPAVSDRPGQSSGSSPGRFPSSFLVAVHDVTPNEREALVPLLHELTARLGGTFSLAVTPRWHGSEPAIGEWAFLRELASLQSAPSEPPDLLLHGLTHRRRPNPNPISIVNRFADEWSGLPREQLRAELGQARRLVRRIFGRDPVGVVAPCWRWGAFDHAMMCEHELPVAVGYRSAWFADPEIPPVPLATISRDWGWMTPAQALLARWPSIRHGWASRRSQNAKQPASAPTPCVVFHPIDVHRGLHLAGLREIDRLLAQGARPARLGQVGATLVQGVPGVSA